MTCGPSCCHLACVHPADVTVFQLHFSRIQICRYVPKAARNPWKLMHVSSALSLYSNSIRNLWTTSHADPDGHGPRTDMSRLMPQSALSHSKVKGITSSRSCSFSLRRRAFSSSFFFICFSKSSIWSISALFSSFSLLICSHHIQASSRCAIFKKRPAFTIWPAGQAALPEPLSRTDAFNKMVSRHSYQTTGTCHMHRVCKRLYKLGPPSKNVPHLLFQCAQVLLLSSP